MSEALRTGERSYTSVREMVRVAPPETEREWLAATEAMSASQVRDAVRGHERGARPGDAPKAELETHRVTLELSPEAYALWKESRALAVQRAGEYVDDSAFVRGAMLAFLGAGPERDAGVAAYQIALTVDERGGAHARAGGERVPVDDVVVEMARCDAQEIGVVNGAEVAKRASQTVPPRVRRQVCARHDGCCAVPG